MAKRKATKRTQKKTRGGNSLKAPFSVHPKARTSEGGAGVDIKYWDPVTGVITWIYHGPPEG